MYIINCTALHYAALEKNVDIIQMILDKDASLLYVADSREFAALHYTLITDNYEEDCKFEAFEQIAKNYSEELLQTMLKQENFVVNIKKYERKVPERFVAMIDAKYAQILEERERITRENQQNEGLRNFIDLMALNNDPRIQQIIRLLNAGNHVPFDDFRLGGAEHGGDDGDEEEEDGNEEDEAFFLENVENNGEIADIDANPDENILYLNDNGDNIEADIFENNENIVSIPNENVDNINENINNRNDGVNKNNDDVNNSNDVVDNSNGVIDNNNNNDDVNNNNDDVNNNNDDVNNNNGDVNNNNGDVGNDKNSANTGNQ